MNRMVRKGRWFVNWYTTADDPHGWKLGVNSYGKGKRIGYYANLGSHCFSIGRLLR